MEAARPAPLSVESDRQSAGTQANRSARLIRLVTSPGTLETPDAERLSRLLVATSRGDRAAFSRLYELTSGKLHAVALRILGQHEVAEETLQDAYLTIWRRAAQHRPGSGSPMGWMVTVVRHRAIDRLRKDRRADVEHGEDPERAVADQEPSFDEALETGRMNASVRECLAGLPTNHRNAVLAAFHQGLSHQELARRFDVPVGTAKSWVRRGLQQLRACLESRDGTWSSE